jgi:hypothetical protein
MVLGFSIVASLGLASLVSHAQRSDSGASLDHIVHALAQRQADNRAAARAYSIVREYRLFASETAEKPDSIVVARVQFLPPETTQYSILSSSGSSRGLGIVRRILDDESAIKKEPQSYGINPENYNFAFEGEQVVDGHRCYLLGLQPRRQDHRLLNGRAWIDAESFQIRLIEGEPAKSPSWWLKRVHLTMRYGDLGGVWAPLSTQAVADVRWFGKRVFTSRELSGQVGSTVAETRASQRNPAVYYSRPLPSKSRGRRPVGSIPTVVGIDVPEF